MSGHLEQEVHADGPGKILRTQAGLIAARARGKKGGRPQALTARQIGIAQDLYEKHHPIAEICRTFKMSKATLYRYIKLGGRER